jgi:RNase P subunit RPR2
MSEQTSGARALVATCKNCHRTLVLFTDLAGDARVKFEDDAPVYIECPDCHFTHPYGASDVQWVDMARAH